MKKILHRAAGALAAAKTKIYAMTLTVMVFFISAPAYASDIGGSIIATGTQNLIADLTTWLLIVAPALTIVAIGYYFVRKAISDEIDHKKWNTRITTAIISCVGVMTASVIIKVVLSYYN